MKRIFLTIALIFTFATSFGQNAYQQRQTKYFVEAAATEFGLDEAQKTELTELRYEMVAGYAEASKNKKSGAITPEEFKEDTKEISKTFNNGLIKITGKKYPELSPFMARLRKELKTVK
ncbi:Zn-dependent oligopeptidase [Flavicella sediminum]|uniref:Zn-dependent oligopeptidase n=1 Tax=Flavicella sediminum TaxID=2585141 RepID=UPI00111FFFC0|nr:Zn-dependent oligopeptidase [Flavicella sediminum]